MGTKLPPDQMLLYRRIDELLHYVWDPIGISGIPEARDEYQSYLPRVFKMVVDKVPDQHIADYLLLLESDSMGLGKRAGRKKRIADLLESMATYRDQLLDDA
jgi:hypothetical protein